ncbi:uncharacterized protein LOC113005100 isoform X1 [Solenopsis invicta]|uniref:uncharacterized protein LOC113005100 isoform X1 n=1 Tax=Solenopsis invicta TaxID=13686 RepID=UPI000E33F285|nr:uncharacterized protein LOC113005100 isoform X1 [Solenopsis invicta]
MDREKKNIRAGATCPLLYVLYSSRIMQAISNDPISNCSLVHETEYSFLSNKKKDNRQLSRTYHPIDHLGTTAAGTIALTHFQRTCCNDKYNDALYDRLNIEGSFFVVQQCLEMMIINNG